MTVHFRKDAGAPRSAGRQETPPNQYRDILIAETAIKNGLTLTAWPQRPKGNFFPYVRLESQECTRKAAEKLHVQHTRYFQYLRHDERRGSRHRERAQGCGAGKRQGGFTGV